MRNRSNRQVNIKARQKLVTKPSKRAKPLLHNGALAAIRHSKDINDYYQRKVADGKHEMRVINNSCNKLLQRIFAWLSRRKKYNEIYTPTLV